MLEGTINILENLGEIGLHLLDSTGSILVVVIVLVVAYILAKSVWKAALKLLNGNVKK